jgi:hypothetical protein
LKAQEENHFVDQIQSFKLKREEILTLDDAAKANQPIP